MKILVTGGLGFIGSHTVVELQEAGFEVIIIDNCSNASEEVLDGIKAITGKEPLFYKIDLRDKGEVRAFFEVHTDLKGIIHFAASKAVGESVEKPLLYYENNIGTLVYLLQFLSELDDQNFIFSSSCTVYGQADVLPITEHSAVKPAESPYGNTKQIGEEIIRDSCRVAPDLHAISLRYFNPVGSHPSTNIGELPLGVPANLVPFITQTAAGVRKELSVFGDDYPTPDGTCIRDYIHVVDLAKAHVVALQRLLESKQDGNYEVFNVGTGSGSSVLEVINSFERMSGEKLKYKIVERRPGDVVSAYADTKKANEVLGWKAEMNLDDAMRDAWKWEQKIRN
ncbi:MAG: UDP-glucose 4-epimerase GalE [Eudoraea sp.]|nr:UDP-glucose 4-epimerase GalE [Eudoraea sp.]